VTGANDRSLWSRLGNAVIFLDRRYGAVTKGSGWSWTERRDKWLWFGWAGQNRGPRVARRQPPRRHQERCRPRSDPDASGVGGEAAEL